MLTLIGIFIVALFLLPYAKNIKYGIIPNILFTPDKELNIFI